MGRRRLLRMEEKYYDVGDTGSYGGVDRLVRATGKTRRSTKDWLIGQDTYSLHKPVRYKFVRRQTLTTGTDQLWQLDLVDCTSLARYNDNRRYILTCIDCFSRYAFVRSVRNKSAMEVKDSFADILNTQARRPAWVQTDKGREFTNAIFQEYLKSNGILFYTSENDDIKCALVERFNRTLKSRMWRYFTHRSTYRYLDILQPLVDSYNNSFHRTIKASPSSVGPHNENKLFRRLYSDRRTPIKWTLAIGDQVRISKTRRTFQKGYTGHWSREIFTVTARLPSDPVTYEIKDQLGEKVEGKFYSQELQKITGGLEGLFKIERVIRTRKKKNGKIEYLVHWAGYPSKFDSWVDDFTVVD